MLNFESIDTHNYMNVDNYNIPFQPWTNGNEPTYLNEQWKDLQETFENKVPAPPNLIDQSGLASLDPISPPNARERFTYTKYQIELLNRVFQSIRYPNANQKLLIAKRIGITKDQVKIWFQNRRRKDITKSKNIQISGVVPDCVVNCVITELLSNSTKTSATSSNVKRCKTVSPAELDMQSPPNVIAPSAKKRCKRVRDDVNAPDNELESCKPIKKRRRSLEVAEELFPPNRVCSSRLPIPGLPPKPPPEVPSYDYVIPSLTYNDNTEPNANNYDSQSMLFTFLNNKNLQLPALHGQDSCISNNISDISFLPSPLPQFSHPDIQQILSFQPPVINEKNKTFATI